jgi:hypothetical protein
MTVFNMMLAALRGKPETTNENMCQVNQHASESSNHLFRRIACVAR